MAGSWNLIASAGAVGASGQIVSDAPQDGHLYARDNAIWVATAIPAPQGRLSLITQSAITYSNVVGATVIYYVPYTGNSVPVYCGSYGWVPMSIGNQLSITLDNGAGGQQPYQLYDVYVYPAGGGAQPIGVQPALGIGMPGLSGAGLNGWNSLTARQTASAIVLSSVGLWTNQSAIYIRTGPGATTSLAAGYGTYLGTFYATAAGQTSFITAGQGAGGGNFMLGLWNAYNRERTYAWCQDTTASWTTPTANTWRPMDGSVGNRISFVDGLGWCSTSARLSVRVTQTGTYPQMGIGYSSITVPSQLTVLNNPNTDQSLSCAVGYGPQLGFNYWQALESVSATTPTTTWYGGGWQLLQIEMNT